MELQINRVFLAPPCEASLLSFFLNRKITMDYNVFPISTRQCLYKCLYRRIVGSCPLLHWNYSNFTKKICFGFFTRIR
nr:MAG TPA: hypothetical protein [Caudoviricetes sp.]